MSTDMHRNPVEGFEEREQTQGQEEVGGDSILMLMDLEKDVHQACCQVSTYGR